MDLGLNGQIALVTGASSGLGYACAGSLLEEGARIAITGSHEGRITAAAEALSTDSTRVTGAVLDLTRPDHPRTVVDAVTRHFGAPPDTLVVSTGGPPSGTFDTLDDDAWERGIDLVLRGLVRTVRACLPGMRESNRGRIVVITSIAAKEPIDALLVSSALRAGVHGLVNALAREVGPDGITINAVMPGYTRTERLIELADRWAAQRNTTPEAIIKTLADDSPIRRICEPAELAATVSFLCSDQAAAINGVALPVDGGALRSI
ncbi:MAG: short-chain dehydrogenase [Planctomycetes bacterium]|nr:short-chain dehydrogenase [Planctomycetota bacterium]